MDDVSSVYLNVAETAKRLGVHRNTVLSWVRQGILTSARLPGARAHRFHQRDVERLLRQRGAPVASVSDDRITVGPELVTGSQLSQWARLESRDAQQTLPELLRRLLLATDGVTVKSMASGDGISSEGWDGLVEVRSSRFLPEGPIGIEMGTDRRIRAKAQADYDKRTKDPLGLDPAAATFVFVTPHRWKQGATWVAERLKDEVWRDVMVIDADILEAWLRATPSVHIWISEHLGRRPRHAETLGTWWERYRTKTNPPLPLALFASGRAAVATRLTEFLASPPDTLVLQSTWIEDVLAFVYATLAGPDGQSEHAREPVIVVDDAGVWDDIVAQSGRVVLIPTYAGADVAAAQAAGHHVVLPAGRDQVLSGTVVELPKPSRDVAAKAFEDVEIALDEAHRLAGLARRSLPSLVRTRARDPRHAHPPWSEPPDGPLVAALTLVGSWTPSDPDHAVVAEITGRDWTAVEERLLRWHVNSDRPFVLSANRWHVASAEDAFRLVGAQLTPPVLARWREVARKVLLEVDPLAELGDDERMLAQVRGVGREHSATIRSGLVRGAALLGSVGETKFSDGSTAEYHANRLVGTLLREANGDRSGKLWRSLASELPLLAEAAPSVFLESVHDALDQERSVLFGMFRDQGDASWLGASSPHSDLLWALETLCWHEDYLLESVRALARLNAIDTPRGTLGNRPHRSLARVLVPWIRHTSAPLDVRKQAIHVVCRQPGGTGWELVKALWPSHHATSSPPASPRFRDWKPDSAGMPMAEWFELVSHVVDAGIRLAGADLTRWGELMERLGPIAPSQRSAAIETLGRVVAEGDFSYEGRLQLWTTVRDIVAHHRAFADADWAMDEVVLEEIASLAAQLEPTAAAERNAHLFDWRPDLLEVKKGDYEAYNAELERLRAKAIQETIEAEGIEGLMRLIRLSPHPHLTGATAGSMPIDGSDQTFIGWLGGDDYALSEFARTWATALAFKGGDAWLANALSSKPAVTDEQKVGLALGAPAYSGTWNTLEANSPDLLDEYWRRAQLFRVPGRELPTALRALITHDRPMAAIELAAHDLHPSQAETSGMTPELAQFVLDALRDAKELDEHPPQQIGYEIGTLLDYLGEHDVREDVIAGYEFAFFRLIEDHRPAQSLARLLGANPADYVQLVCRIYRGKDEPPGDPTESERVSADHAWWVLNGWRRLPGLDDEGGVDAEHLADWVNTARLLLAEADRGDIGDEQVGQVLAMSPPGTDAAWPHESVRDLIEVIGNHHIDTGVYIGRVNSRGVVSRHLYAGGEQERGIAAQYRAWARQMHASHPRTARILRRLAESYEHDARDEDSRAEWDQDAD